MPTLLERWQVLWGHVKESSAVRTARFHIPSERTDRSAELGQPFKKDQHYFQVRVNEMFLARDRQWFTSYDPLVFVVSEFLYDKAVQAVPFVVGPSLLEQYKQELPEGMVFENIRVAGLHPYKGGRLNLAVVLYQTKRQNYAHELLAMIERTAGVLDFSTALSSYLKVATAVLDGIEDLFRLGDTVPLIGMSTQIDPDAGDVLAPGYFVLINAPEGRVDASQFWVSQNRLLIGDTLQTAQPYGGADYVLYSIAQTERRSEEETLPFYPLFEQAKDAAGRATQDGNDDPNWKSARAAMVTLAVTLDKSPDLIAPQSEELVEQYKDELLKLRKRVLELGALSGPVAEQPSPEDEQRLRKAVDILDM